LKPIVRHIRRSNRRATGAQDANQQSSGTNPSEEEQRMATVPWEQRVEVLESELIRLKARLENPAASSKPWWDEIWGSFAGDPAFEEAMELGRQYREAQRPEGCAGRKG
jgi:hypothetical protein